jgi:hypothetical protein
LGIELTEDLPIKTDEYLALASQLPKASRIGLANPQYASWREYVEKAVIEGLNPKVGGYPILRMKTDGGRVIFCLHRDAAPFVRENMEKFANTEQHIVRDIKPKSIKPDSSHITPHKSPAHMTDVEREKAKRRGRDRD